MIASCNMSTGQWLRGVIFRLTLIYNWTHMLHFLTQCGEVKTKDRRIMWRKYIIGVVQHNNSNLKMYTKDAANC